MIVPATCLTDPASMQSSLPPRRPGTSALRRGRHSAYNHVYHITTCTRDRSPLLERFSTARSVINEMRREDQAGNTETLAFVIMPDHWHWLIRLSGRRSLSSIVSIVKSFSARQINKELRRKGPIWQRGFHDHCIRAEEDLANAARYIIANPLRAGLVGRIGEYPHWDAVWL